MLKLYSYGSRGNYNSENNYSSYSLFSVAGQTLKSQQEFAYLFSFVPLEKVFIRQL